MSDLLLINRYAQIYIQVALNRGFDLPTIFARSGIKNKTSATDSFSYEDMLKLSRHVKLLLEDEFCGLTKTSCRLGAIEFMFDLATSAATLEEALEKAFQFYAILTDDLRFSLLRLDDATAAVQIDLANPELDPYHFLYEWWLRVIWGIAGWLIAERIEPLLFTLPHPAQLPVAEYENAFGCECRFEQAHARLVLRRELLSRPVVRTPADIKEMIFQPHGFGEIPGLKVLTSVRLRSFLKARFSETKNFPDMDEAAAHCHCAAHTLRRKLAEEGTSFTEIKDNIRREAALKLLSAPAMTIDSVAHEAGFRDTSSFSRAVKNWTGLYPTQYRDSLRH